MEVKKNDIVTLEMAGYGSDGAAISHLEDGRVVFVAGALSAERCRVQLLRLTKSACWGRVEEILQPSPARVESDCAYYPRCGGCQLRHMSYEEELNFKKNRVQDALERIGGTQLRLSCIHGAAETRRYRNKLQFPLARDAEGGAKIGFFRARSHDVIDVEDCLLQPEAGTALRAALKDWMQKNKVAAFDERSHTGLVRHLYVRTNRAGQSLCVVVVNAKKLPEEPSLVEALRAAEPKLVGVVISINKERTNVILGRKLRGIWGEKALTDTLCELSFSLSPHAFYQVNREQTELLYARVLEFAALEGGETVLDLYCGIGTITLALAKRAGRVIGAEVVEEAVEDARANAERNGMDNVEYLCGDAGEIAETLLKRGERPAVICVDPPRKGLTPACIDAMAAMRPQRIVYVSCDPGTLGRDIKLLAAQGYEAKRAEAVDLFPRTVHIEVVIQMTYCGDKKK